MPKEQLARKLTLPLLLFYGLGNILGAGIYVLIGEVALTAGMYAPLSFLVALLIASFTALSYSELASRYPVSAGEAVYIKEALGSTALSVSVGLTIAAAGLISAATIARGSAGYLSELIEINEIFAIAGVIGILAAVAIWGITQSVTIAAVLTVVEIGGLLLILWVGAPAFLTIPEKLPELIPPLEWETWHTIFLGGFLAFFAFLGFEDMVNVAEEVKEPSRTFPKAIGLALAIATLLYIGVSLVTVLLLTPQQLTSTSAPFSEIYRHATGEDALIITYISIFAIINGALIQMIMASRILYGMSKKGWLPIALSHVNSRTRTPVVATVAVMFITLSFALWLPLVTLANLTSSLILVVFTVVNISLIRIKRADPDPEGIRTIPLWVPWTGAVVNVLFLLLQLLPM